MQYTKYFDIHIEYSIFWGRFPNSKQLETRKFCFFASVRLTFEPHPKKTVTLDSTITYLTI